MIIDFLQTRNQIFPGYVVLGEQKFEKHFQSFADNARHNLADVGRVFVITKPSLDTGTKTVRILVFAQPSTWKILIKI